MENKREKPTPEAKALSLYLMAHKKTSPNHKEKSRRLNKLWSQVLTNDIDLKAYLYEVGKMLKSFGGYSKVVEDTVSFYINKTGEWKLEGEDKYCLDAKEVADKLLKK